MQKQISLQLEENLILEATAIFDYYGLDMQTGVKMFLTRVTKDRSVSFLFGQANQSANAIPVQEVLRQENLPDRASNKLTKNGAIRLLKSKGYDVYNNVTFASKNKTAYHYWANPSFELLKHNWSFILNDNINRTLYLFNIPARSISKSQLMPRADRPELIDIQIRYEDNTFPDNVSDFKFSGFLVHEVDY